MVISKASTAAACSDSKVFIRGFQDSPVSDPEWPLDHELFAASAADTIRRLRSHACLALWCGATLLLAEVRWCAALRRMLPVVPCGERSSCLGVPAELFWLCILHASCTYCSSSLSEAAGSSKAVHVMLQGKV